MRHDNGPAMTVPSVSPARRRASAMFLALLALAVGHADAQEESRANLKPVRLIEAGEESSRSSARYRGVAEMTPTGSEPVEIGRVQTATVTSRIRIGETDAVERELPTVRVRSFHQLEVTPKDPGTLSRSIRIERVELMATPGVEPSDMRAIRVAATAVKGARRVGRIDAFGRSLAPAVWGFEGPFSRASRRFVDDAVLDLGRVPLPQEPIGVGAKWKTPMTVLVAGEARDMETTWTRVESSGDGTVSELDEPNVLHVRMERVWESTSDVLRPIEHRIAYRATGEFTIDLSSAAIIAGRYLEDVISTPKSGAAIRTTRSATITSQLRRPPAKDDTSPEKDEPR